MNSPSDCDSERRDSWSCLPLVGLGMVSLGLSVSVLVIVGVSLDIIHVAWNAKVLPRLLLFGLLPFSIFSLGVSIVAYWRHRSWVSIIALVLGIVGAIAAGLTFLTVISVAIAGHPL